MQTKHRIWLRTGEDCNATEPYVSSDESIILGPYCHPTDGDGASLTLNYPQDLTPYSKEQKL